MKGENRVDEDPGEDDSPNGERDMGRAGSNRQLLNRAQQVSNRAEARASRRQHPCEKDHATRMLERGETDDRLGLDGKNPGPRKNQDACSVGVPPE